MSMDEDLTNVINLDSRRPPSVRLGMFLRRAEQLVADHATPADNDLEQRVSAIEAFIKKTHGVRDIVCAGLELKKMKTHC